MNLRELIKRGEFKILKFKAKIDGKVGQKEVK